VGRSRVEFSDGSCGVHWNPAGRAAGSTTADYGETATRGSRDSLESLSRIVLFWGNEADIGLVSLLSVEVGERGSSESTQRKSSATFVHDSPASGNNRNYWKRFVYVENSRGKIFLKHANPN